MGIAESKLLGTSILQACSKAEQNGKTEIDGESLFKNQAFESAAKKIYKNVPKDIKSPVRRSAVERAIAHTPKKITVSKVAEEIRVQVKRISVQGIFNGPVTIQGPSPSSHNPLADYYLLQRDVEKQSELNKIRTRFICVSFNRLTDGARLPVDTISFFAETIKRSGAVHDTQDEIQNNLRVWVERGKRYDSLAMELGGLGVLFLLPDAISETVWNHELPMDKSRENRKKLLKGLKDGGISDQAKGFHATGNTLLSQALDPMRLSVQNALPDAFEQMNLAVGCSPSLPSSGTTRRGTDERSRLEDVYPHRKNSESVVQQSLHRDAAVFHGDTTTQVNELSPEDEMAVRLLSDIRESDRNLEYNEILAQEQVMDLTPIGSQVQFPVATDSPYFLPQGHTTSNDQSTAVEQETDSDSIQTSSCSSDNRMDIDQNTDTDVSSPENSVYEPAQNSRQCENGKRWKRMSEGSRTKRFPGNGTDADQTTITRTHSPNTTQRLRSQDDLPTKRRCLNKDLFLPNTTISSERNVPEQLGQADWDNDFIPSLNWENDSFSKVTWEDVTSGLNWENDFTPGLNWENDFIPGLDWENDFLIFAGLP